ncbi:hypothetical protein [Paenibacillus faecalis]|uniref:hypothetical protein n=1 Tax=Paenibacillus faecalis TaxID=2079532 RepID=UPI000D0F4971|nr:hypothetical protein [Paenibacillus faecalis]
MSEFVVFFIIVGMCAFQYFLAKFFIASRNSFLLGAIVPLMFTAGMTWMFITNSIESTTKYIVLLLVGLIFLIEEWVRGRRSLHKRRQKEMDMMKAKDL